MCCDSPLIVMLCVFWALSVGLTCCFLMQRLTDNGAAQKLPSSGLNPETAQGDALLTLSLSPSFALYASHAHTQMKCVNLTPGLVFICCQFCRTVTLLHTGVLHFKLTTNPRVSDGTQ